MDNITKSLEQACDLLKTVMFATMATVNDDGSPHSSPFFVIYDDKLDHIFWGSHPESIHSKNIKRTGEVFFSIYNSHKYSTGIYIKAINGKSLVGEELENALVLHNTFRAKYNKSPIDLSYYINGPQQMWSADTVKFWINSRKEDENGRLVEDVRIEVRPQQLIEC